MSNAIPSSGSWASRKSLWVSPTRIAGAYVLFGLLWIWLSDGALIWGGLEFRLFLAAAAKGTLFVLLSGLLVFWIARREFRQVSRSYALLQAVVDETTDAIFVKDRDGKYLLFNEAAARFVGKPIDEVLGRDDTELFDPAGARLVMERDRGILAAGVAETREEELTAAGVTRTYQATKAPYRGDAGEILGLIGVSRDVTDRKLVETQLRAERDRFEKIMEAVPVVICSFLRRPDGSVSFPYAAPRIEQIYGIPPEELARDGSLIYPLFHPEDAERVKETIEESTRSLSLWKCEFRVTNPSRGVIWVEGCSAPVRLPDGSTLWHGYVADVTERKRFEEELHKAHRFSQLVADIVPSALYVFDLEQGRAVYVNRAAEQMLGYSAEVREEQFTGKPEEVIHPDDLPGSQAHTLRAAGLADGEFSSFEFRMRRADGTWAWFDTRAAVFARRPDGSARQLIGTATDITERKQAADELRASEERFRTLVDHATDAIFLHTHDGVVIDANRAACESLGYTREELIGMYPTQFDPSVSPELMTELLATLDAGKVVSVDSVHRRKDGSTFPVEVRIKPFANAGKRFGLSAVRDITQRKRAEDELRGERDRLAKLAASAPGVLHSFRLRPDGSRHFAYVSPAVEALFGCTPDDLARDPNLIRDRIHPEDLPRHLAALEESAKAGTRLESECRARHPSRGEIWVKFQTAPTPEPDGGTLWHGFMLDVTERRREEQKLRESEEWLRLAHDAADLGIWRHDLLTNVVTLDASAQAHFSLPATIDRSQMLDRTHPDDRQRIGRALDSKLRPAGTGRTAAEYRVVHPDGRVHWVAVQVRTLFEGEGAERRARSAFGVSQDITERKRAESALRESEQRFRTLVDHATDAIFLSTDDGVVVDVNRAACESLGYGREELIGVHPRVFDPSLEGEGESGSAFQFQDGETVAFDSVYRRKDGSTFPVEVRVRPFRIGEQQFGLAVARDITQRKRAEDELRGERDRLAKLAATAPGVLHSFRLRPDGSRHYPYVSPAVRDIFGFEPEVLLRDAAPLRDMIHPNDLPRHLAAVAESARTLTPFETECRVRHPSRGELWVKIQSAPIREPDGGTVWHGFIFDVTERRREEQKLRESEEWLRLAYDAADLGIWRNDLAAGVVTLDDRSQSHYGLSGPAASLSDILDRVHPEDRDRLGREITAAFGPAGTGRTATEYRVIHPDGKVHWVAVQVRILFEGEGAARRATVGYGVSQDVTERKSSEAALRESEERLRLALAAGRLGIWECDLRSKAVYWSPEAYSVMGMGVADFGGTLEDFARLIYPEDRDGFWAKVAVSLAVGGPPFDHEFRVTQPDGQVRWLMNRAEPIRDSAGQAVRLIGVVADVSDRRLAEAAIRENESRFRTLIEVLPSAVFVHDGERIVFCNPAFVRLMGAGSPEEVLGLDPFRVAHPDYHPLARARLEAMIQHGAPVAGVEMQVVRLDGRAVPVHSVATPIVSQGLRGYLVALSDLSERERSMNLLRTVMASVNDTILTIDERGVVTTCNPSAERMFGYSEPELIGENVRMLMPPPYHDEHDGYLANYLRTGVGKVIGIGREVEGLRKDGTKFPLELTVTEFRLDGNRHFTGVVRDISARRRLEEQFRQAQKMEAVGRLAGGVAHDFNNLLTVINGFSDLVLMTMPGDDDNRAAVLSIRDAGERAAGLTSQLLAFSRKAIVAPRVLDLKEVVAHSERLLRRLIGADIALSVTSHPEPCRIEADPSQLDQVIINLAVNARDAMPRGGRLSIETNRVQIASAETTESGEIRAGWYAELAVSDNGCGMTSEVKSKLFEPFFTTKGQGKGTGLGLAVVHGVVKQAGGHVSVESEVDRGTTFRILFPEVPAPPPTEATPEAELFQPGTETVLLVEDEDSVRHLCRIALESRGYTVLVAAHGREALEVIGGFGGKIDLLISDVVMPEMSGRELVDAAREIVPGLKILFMSGYTDDSVVRHGVREATDAFIQKPFGPFALAKKVRALLDEPF